MQRALFVLTFALGLTLAGEVARAFDCTGVTLPSSIVICNDPDLMRVADERQEAVNDARARLTDEQFRALMADQTRTCRQLSQIVAAARWMAARKFLAVLS